VTGNANRHGSNKNSLLTKMLRTLPRLALRLLAVLLPLGLGACADTLTSGQPLASSTELLHGYDKTLTKTEQQAAINELKSDQAKAAQQESAAQQDATAAPASATPAAKQD
jgi:hypothetical protein